MLFIFTVFAARAQDTLIRRSGDTLVVRLTEVNPYDVRYTMLNYADGPVFNIFKEDLKEIHYGNGYRESFASYVPPYRAGKTDAELAIYMSGKRFYYKERKISEADMLGIVGRLGDQRLNRIIHKTDQIKLFQNVAGVAAAALFLSGAYVYRANAAPGGRGRRFNPATTTTGQQARKNGTILMLCGLGAGVLSVTFVLERRKNDRILVNAYNSTIYRH